MILFLLALIMMVMMKGQPGSLRPASILTSHLPGHAHQQQRLHHHRLINSICAIIIITLINISYSYLIILSIDCSAGGYKLILESPASSIHNLPKLI